MIKDRVLVSMLVLLSMASLGCAASDGAPQWKLNLKGCVRSIGSSGDTLFIGVQEGTIYAFEVKARMNS